MNRLSFLFLTLLGSMSACSAQGIGQTFSEKKILASAVCQYATCQQHQIRQVGDKFGLVSEQYTIHEWKLIPPVKNLSNGMMSVRVSPAKKIDVLKLDFTIPKNAKMDSARELILSWLKSFDLNEKSAGKCLGELGKKPSVNLNDTKKKLIGECYVEEYKAGSYEVSFSFSPVSY